jgi:hypothetical protein
MIGIAMARSFSESRNSDTASGGSSLMIGRSFGLMLIGVSSTTARDRLIEPRAGIRPIQCDWA